MRTTFPLRDHEMWSSAQQADNIRLEGGRPTFSAVVVSDHPVQFVHIHIIQVGTVGVEVCLIAKSVRK